MDSSSQMQRALSEIAKRHAQLFKSLSPPSGFTEAVKALQGPQLRIANEMAAIMKRHQAMLDEVARPMKIMDDIHRQLAASQAFMNDILTPVRELQEQIRQQALMFESITARAAEIQKLRLTIPQISRSAFAWQCATATMANRMREVGLLAQRAALAQRLFSAPIAYTEFLRDTSEKLATTSSEKRASALRGSIVLAENQLLGISESLSEFIAVPEDHDTPTAVPQLLAPMLQRDELVLRDDVLEDDPGQLVSVSPTARLVAQSREILDLIALCNEAGRTSTGAEMFKPTTRLLQVFAEFPWLVATDRKRFAEVVDCLYFLLYEGAGKDKLRFMTAQGGPLDDGDCDLIWCIKHLRNKWVRHDADHGKEKDILKSWNDLSKQFRWLGLSQHPTEPSHFRALQERLLAQSKVFLKEILNRMTLRE